jgi:hypothetical protein
MSLRRHARTGIALAAAYAVALQAVLLAFGVPGAGAAVPLCSAAAGHAAPAGQSQAHSQGQSQEQSQAQSQGQSQGQSQEQRNQDHNRDCLAACLTGCCSSAPICPMPVAAAIDAPAPAQQLLTVASAVERVWAARATNAHRSRAPPRA